MKKQSNQKSSGFNPKYIFISVLIIVVAYLVFHFFIKEEKKPEFTLTPDRTEQRQEVQEPQFVKQGNLSFIRATGEPLASIDIEVADSPAKRSQGLMYRKSMEENHGMLFIFPMEEPQSFWMKNTIIPLDIIFVNSNKQIVKIHKNTTPFSERSMLSEKPAIYVVEVIAGYTDKFNIREGDRIDWELE